uniref:DNA polymerase delta subunit 3 n=1 Tax=Ditylenchus dipsaci TaxID=166011 RepID=A0A915CW30_9BILA
MPFFHLEGAGEPKDNQSKTITTFRHEKVTDTYVDEDGFTVTRTVPKLVETEEVVVVRPSSQRPVLKSSNTVNSKPSKSKVATGQPTISSFFTKK